MPLRIAANIRMMMSQCENPRIVILGATYKRNCEDLRESPAIRIVEELYKDGYDVTHYDPLVPDMGYDSLEEVSKDSDLLAVLVSHDIIIDDIKLIKWLYEKKNIDL